MILRLPLPVLTASGPTLEHGTSLIRRRNVDQSTVVSYEDKATAVYRSKTDLFTVKINGAHSFMFSCSFGIYTRNFNLPQLRYIMLMA